MPEIVRHLVDEERRALAMDTGVGEEIPAEPGELFVRQIVEHLRIA